MSKPVQFMMALVLGLALLTWTASVVVSHTTRDWFSADMSLRAELAAAGAHEALLFHWRNGDRQGVRDILVEIAHDERILGAAICGLGRSLVASPEYPAVLTCDAIESMFRSKVPDSASESKEWTSVADLAGGKVQVDVIPLLDGAKPLGRLVFVHDMAFAERRESKTYQFLLIAFGILSVGAALVTLVAARLAWRGWTDEIRRMLRAGTNRPEYHPIMRDVLDLVDRIIVEKDLDVAGGGWNPQRLKQTLTRYLHGERLIIVANREPYIHERSPDGTVQVLHPASGLVSALEPVIRACSGVWIGHGSGSADRESSDDKGRVRVPPGQESYVLRRVWLTPEEEKGYYYGFSNEGLWPLCHLAHARPIFRSEDWTQYQSVNAKFVDAVASEVNSPDPIVLVQDYHFATAPQMLREKLPRSTIISFWHIPWPNAERLGICPWRKELLEGMLGSSILGFHTQFHCNNFLEAVERYLEARIDRERLGVVQHGRRTLVRPYPISIDWPSPWLKDLPSPAECRASVFRELDLAPGTILGLGVDRLDYIKGVEERLLAVERLLERQPALSGRFTFIQLAAPSRTLIDRYRQLNDSVEALATRINGRFGRGGYRPVILLRSHHEPISVFRYYRAVDLCYVSSLHDGMNLVAKEFVAARDDDRGVLVLSQFAGAAKELTEALIVNPYDLDEASSALLAALNMSAEEQADRMRTMRSYIAEFNVYRWAGRMLVDGARLRRSDRLSGRLTDHRGYAVDALSS